MRSRRLILLAVAVAALAGAATGAWFNTRGSLEPTAAGADETTRLGFHGGDSRIRWFDMDLPAAALFEHRSSIYLVAFDELFGMALNRVEDDGSLTPTVQVPFAIRYGANVAGGDSGAGILEGRALVTEVGGRVALAYGREVVLVDLPSGKVEHFLFFPPAPGVEDSISGLAADGDSLLVTRDGVKGLSVLGTRGGLSLEHEYALPPDFPSPQAGVVVARPGLAIVSALGARPGETAGSVAIDLADGSVKGRFKEPVAAAARTDRGLVLLGDSPGGLTPRVAQDLAIPLALTKITAAGPFSMIASNGRELWFAGGVNASEVVVERGGGKVERYALPQYRETDSAPVCRVALDSSGGCPVTIVERYRGVYSFAARPGGGALNIIYPGTHIGIIDPCPGAGGQAGHRDPASRARARQLPTGRRSRGRP